MDTWYRSVGGNTVFLLKLTPDRRGLIPEKDAARLREMGDILLRSFTENLARGAVIEASQTESGHTPRQILDGDLESFWKPADGNEAAELILELSEEKTFNRLVLQEAITTQGQRIEAFALDAWQDGRWQEITQGTVVGYKNIRRFPLRTASRVRLRILGSRVAPTLAELGLYHAPETLSNPAIRRDKQGMVSMACRTPDPVIHYTLDGSRPGPRSPVFTEAFPLPEGGVVTFTRAIATKLRSGRAPGKAKWWKPGAIWRLPNGRSCP